MPRLWSRSTRGLGVVALCVVLAACATGPRPTLGAPVDAPLGTSGQPTGDPAVDALLARLDAVGDRTFTATYRIVRRLGPLETTATVVQDPPRLSVTVGGVRFVHNGTELTCDLATGMCEPGILDQRISDYMIGSRFYADGPAAALRVAMSRRTGVPELTQEVVAGLTVDCVRVPLGQGSDTTCVTPDGPLARLDTAALDVQLVTWSTEADAAAFASPG